VGFEPTIPAFERAKTIHALRGLHTLRQPVRLAYTVQACAGKLAHRHVQAENTIFSVRFSCRSDHVWENEFRQIIIEFSCCGGVIKDECGVKIGYWKDKSFLTLIYLLN
jgi:hypothetical protein